MRPARPIPRAAATLTAAALALAAAAVLVLPGAAPAHASDHAYAMAHGEHKPAIDSLFVYFREDIHLSSIDPDRMDLVVCPGGEGACVEIPLAGQRLVPAGDSSSTGRFVRVGLSGEAQAALLSAGAAAILLAEGAYLDAAGLPNHPGRVPVLLSGQLLPRLLEGAAYDAARGELAIHLAEAVEPASVEGGLIRVMVNPAREDDDALFTLSGTEPARVAGGGRLLVYDLRPGDGETLLAVSPPYSQAWREHRERLASEENIGLPSVPSLSVSPMAYARASDGMPTHHDSVQISVLDGTGPEQGSLEYAVYAADDNALTLHFRDPVDPFSVRPWLVSVRDEPAGHPAERGARGTYLGERVEPSVHEFASVGPDGRSVAFEPSEINRYRLSLMRNPVVHLEAGAVREAAGGAETGAEMMALEVSGPHIFPLNPDLPPGLLAGRAQYNVYQDAAELVLHFREPVDPSSIDTDRIDIINDDCTGIDIADKPLVGVDPDGGSATFDIGVSAGHALGRMNSTWVRLEQGAFATAADGVPNEAGDLPLHAGLWWDKPRSPVPDRPALFHGLPCHLEYLVESPRDLLEQLGYGGVPVGMVATGGSYQLVPGVPGLFEEETRLYLHFREPIDPSSVEVARIGIADADCNTILTMSGRRITVGDDGTSAVLGMSGDAGHALKRMDAAWLYLERGAFATAAGGVPNEAGYLPLGADLWRVYGENSPTRRDWSGAKSCNPEPDGPDFVDEYTRTVLLPAVRDGLNAWSELNPQITFKRITEGEPDIEVNWLGQADHLAGRIHGGYSSGNLYPGATMAVSVPRLSYEDSRFLGLLDRYNAIRNTVSHEFGHNLQLRHHPDICNLMYAGDNFTQDPFDDLGYTIPGVYNGVGRPPHCMPG